MLFAIIFFLIGPLITFANRFGHGCLPYRELFKLHYPCEEDQDRDGIFNFQDWMRGEPSEFARTGYYDRLFRQQNLIAYQGKYAYYPTYGYNANLPQDKPFGPFYYRYSNFFTNKNA